MMDPLTAEHLGKSFPGCTALTDITLAVPEGICLGLLGPNGSGKSTLLRIAAGLIRASHGRLSVYGQPPSPETRRLTAFLPEEDALYHWMETEEAVGLGRACYPRWNDRTAHELREFLELPAATKVGALSRGMRSRLKLLIALASGARLLLLDEPFAGLDPASRQRVAGALHGFWSAGEQTLILATNTVTEVETLFDRVCVLRGGAILLEGNADDLRARRNASIDSITREGV